ncbi:MAG: NADH-quinone oxidoreductase subunit NuoN [Proteobacteria bacterium]|nr:NADH-quinone oxidoreductase subunit NuoN [Pseudomonadota bacterium]
MTATDFIPVLPELFLGIMTAVILLVGVFVPKRTQVPYYLAQLSLIIAAALTFYCYHVLGQKPTFSFDHGYVLDSFAVILKFFVYLTTFIVFLYSRNYNHERYIVNTEFHVLALLSVIGMVSLISGYNLLTLYLSLELLSLPLYALVALQRAKMRCVEAAIKYFVVGGLASGMLLYGISILFGFARSLDLAAIAHVVTHSTGSNNIVLMLALVFIIAGMAFKIGAVPFHMWVPDVYDGAPTSVTLLLSAAPKIAGLALFVRILAIGLPGLFTQWQQILIVIALLSLALGNIAAIVQVNIKRMLAYSSIAHMGYILLGLACGTAEGNAAAIFYTITYSLMSIGAFGMIALMSRAGFEANDIEDYAGLNQRSPWLALMMMILMFSLAGVPPLVGFMAKLSVLNALVTVHLTWVAVLTILFSIIGAFYYIRVIKVMYFDQALESDKILFPRDAKIAISFNGIAILLLGIFPSVILAYCQNLF